MKNLKKINLFIIVLFSLLLFHGKASGQEAYAVFDETSGTLTLKYDDKKTADAYEMMTEVDKGWSAVNTKITKVVFDETFANYKPTSCALWFYYCSELTEIVGMKEYLNTENVTDMMYMFANCSGLTSLDLSSFNTENVTSMSLMFSGCSSLTSLDLSSFNTGNVRNMSNMFANCSGLTSLDLDNFNTGNVTDMRWMFADCTSLTSLDLSSFNTGNVTNMSRMFGGCSSLTSLDLSSFNTENVTNMWAMFAGCSSLTSLDLSSFNTENVTGMSSMFSGCSSLTSLDVSSFNTENVTNMGWMFEDCTSLTSLDLSSFNTGNVMAGMSGMFSGCSSLTSLDLSSFNTENVTYMKCMFYNCNSLTSLDLSSFNTGNVTNMSEMFHDCSSLTSLDLSNFNTEYVTDMSSMFSGCSSLTSLDLSSFNTAKVTNMSSMFSGCISLTNLDLNSFNTENVTDMSSIFSGCQKLKTIYVGDDWTTDNVTFSEKMFNECSNLVGGKGTVYNESMINATYARIDGGEDAPGYFTDKKSETDVKPKSAVSISITTSPAKMEYIKGEYLDLSEGEITVKYDNGDEEIVELSAAKISGYDRNKPGKQTVTAEYLGLSTAFEVEVQQPEVIEKPENTDVETAVGDLAANSSVKIWSFDKTIFVENANSEITIADMSGHIVKNIKPINTKTEIIINKSGVYIVKTGVKTQKIVIR